MTDITAKSIREKCENDIKELQKVCDHPSSTDCLETWAPAHFTGRTLTICDVCEKVLEELGGEAMHE